MPDKKLTDSEIINTLNEAEGMEHVALYCANGKDENMKSIPMVDIINLINRLQADKEYYKKNRDKYQDDVMFLSKQCDELQAENERLKKGWRADVILTADAKAEAYKECIEKAKSEIDRQSHSRSLEASGERFRIHKILDNLLKEIIGEDK